MASNIGDVYIGTAGYNYSHWRNGNLYPRGLPQNKELRHYSGVFSAVEINNTFHGIPRVETIRGWARDAKEGFRFSIKVPQDITHVRKLGGIGETWSVFLQRIQEGFGNAGDDNAGCLGPILFQLPPSLHCDVSKLHNLATLVPTGMKVVFEFRHPSWYCAEVLEVLNQHGFAICENVSPDGSALRVPMDDAITAGSWCYTRFHKKEDRDVTFYSDDQLAKEAAIIATRAKRGISQFAFFLNDHECNGPKNARTLMRLVNANLHPKVETDNQIDTQQSPTRMTINLVSGWKADHVIEKGGKGSLQAMFAKAAATTGGKNTSRVGSNKVSFSNSRTANDVARQIKSIDATRGTIKTLFANSPQQDTNIIKSNIKTGNPPAEEKEHILLSSVSPSGNSKTSSDKIKKRPLVLPSKASQQLSAKKPRRETKGGILHFFQKK